MRLLVVGGTGTLGRQIVKEALEKGFQVRCLVRNLRRSSFLKEWGAELVYGDLSIPETIPATLKGVSVVIDAATLKPTDDYNAEIIDWKGKIALIEAAKVAKVKNFVFFSFLGADQSASLPLVDLKLKIQNYLKNSGLNHTLFKCTGFFQGLINQYAIPILESRTVWLLGNNPPSLYLDTQDAAKIIVTYATNNFTTQSALIGKKSWTPEQIVQFCERLSGKESKKAYIPPLLLGSLRQILRFFEFSWNIADRLQFSEIRINSNLVISKTDKLNNLLTLEQYLQEYYSRILRKLKENSYQQIQGEKDLPFI